MKKINKILGIFLSLCMLFGTCTGLGFAVSATNKTADDAVNWASSQVGQYLDYDGQYGAQCVDFIAFYYQYLGVGVAYGNGADYAWNALPDGWTRVQGGIPQRGDILVYDSGDYGHVAIYENDGSLYHQNYCGHQYVEHSTFRYDNEAWMGSHYWGCIHPNFSAGSGASVIYPENGTYIIYSALDNSKCVDVAGLSNDNGGNIWLWSNYSGGYQKFNINNEGGHYSICNTGSGKFLDIDSGSTQNGANIQQWDGSGVSWQHWIFEDAGDGYVYIRSEIGTYMDVLNCGTENGTNIKSWSFNGSYAQKFRLAKVSNSSYTFPENGTYIIYSALDNSKCVDVAGLSNDNGGNIWLWSNYSGGYQKFNINNEGEHYAIWNTGSGKFLDIDSGSTQNGANIQQWDGSGVNWQHWIFEDAGDGYVYIRSKTGTYMDVLNCGTENGTNIQSWSFNGSYAQKFRLAKVSNSAYDYPENGTYIIYSALDNSKCVDVAGLSNDNGGNIWLWEHYDGGYQKFNINNEGEHYAIWNTESKKFLDIDSGSTQNGANIQQWAGSGVNWQHWIFEDAGDGYVYIRSKTGMYMDVLNCGTENGTNIQSWSFNGSYAQKFKLQKYTPAADLTLEQIGWKQNLDGTWNYYAEGKAVTSWQNSISGWQGQWFYFYDNGVMASGWTNDISGWTGTWFNFSTNGIMNTGWLFDGAWYYLASNGAMQTGWIFDGAWYYMNSSGVMQTGWQFIDGEWYCLADNGAMYQNCVTPDGYYVDINGKWVG